MQILLSWNTGTDTDTVGPLRSSPTHVIHHLVEPLPGVALPAEVVLEVLAEGGGAAGVANHGVLQVDQDIIIVSERQVVDSLPGAVSRTVGLGARGRWDSRGEVTRLVST